MSDIGMILDRLGKTLVMDIAPQFEGEYAAGSLGMIGLMSVMAGEAWDGAADRLVNEISGMAALIQAAGQPVPDGAASYKLSDLTAARDAHADALIALQVKLEAETTPDSAALNAKIWGFLLKTAAARMPSPPAFPDKD